MTSNASSTDVWDLTVDVPPGLGVTQLAFQLQAADDALDPPLAQDSALLSIVHVERSVPTLSSSYGASGAAVTANPVVFTCTFSQPVINVEAADWNFAADPAVEVTLVVTNVTSSVWTLAVAVVGQYRDSNFSVSMFNGTGIIAPPVTDATNSGFWHWCKYRRRATRSHAMSVTHAGVHYLLQLHWQQLGTLARKTPTATLGAVWDVAAGRRRPTTALPVRRIPAKQTATRARALPIWTTAPARVRQLMSRVIPRAVSHVALPRDVRTSAYPSLSAAVPGPDPIPYVVPPASSVAAADEFGITIAIERGVSGATSADFVVAVHNHVIVHKLRVDTVSPSGFAVNDDAGAFIVRAVLQLRGNSGPL